MKTLILCDRESLEHHGVDLCARVRMAVREAGSDEDVVVLNGDEIKPCLGCFHCWVRTPGLCITTNDGANTVAGQEIRSDVVIFLSRIVYGGYSYDVKSFLDRSIPNLSPFFEIIDGEMRHKMRYERFPYVIFIGYGPCRPEERETFIRLAERNALNMRPPKHFVFTMQNTEEAEATIHALTNVLSRQVSP